VKLDSGILTTTSVLVATGGKAKLYSSPQQVPPDERAQLKQAMESDLTATLVIADPAGQEWYQRKVKQQQAEQAAPPKKRLRLKGWTYVIAGVALTGWALAGLGAALLVRYLLK
jgi:hypothetical protein